MHTSAGSSIIPVISGFNRGKRVLLDSDLLSDILKGQNPRVKIYKDAYALQFRQLEFTSASVLEILYRLHRIGAKAQIQRAEAVCSSNHEIAPDPLDYRLAAEIGGALDRQGTPIGLIDPLIAACAIRRGYGVATANTTHYGFIHKAGYTFHLENW